LSGGKAELTGSQWSPLSGANLASAVNLAERALEASQRHTQHLWRSALASLLLQISALGAAVALAIGGVLLVGRRVTGPLQSICNSMELVANGDLSSKIAFAARADEIGTLASALATFKENAVEKP
jgi:HAMP domain-containing protein